MYSLEGLESESESENAHDLDESDLPPKKEIKAPRLDSESSLKECMQISFGKQLYTCFTINITQVPFEKTADCIDIVSYDVGTKNLGCSRIRYCRSTHRCCIVYAALIDIYEPFVNENLKAGDKRGFDQIKPLNNKKCRKPPRVQLFDGAKWPQGVVETRVHQTEALKNFHLQTLQKHATGANDSEKDKWTKDVLRLSLAIQKMGWTVDQDIDFILVEHQHNDNIHMRVLGYCIIEMYQTMRMCSLMVPANSFPCITTKTEMQLFSSILKLSEGIVNTLLQSWKLDTVWNHAKSFPSIDLDVEEEDEEDAQKPKIEILSLEQFEQAHKKKKGDHDEMINRASHGQRKQSSVRVLEHLMVPVNEKIHPFRDWLRVQRKEKHNVCDSVLQAMAWIVKHEQEPAMLKKKLSKH